MSDPSFSLSSAPAAVPETRPSTSELPEHLHAVCSRGLVRMFSLVVFEVGPNGDVVWVGPEWRILTGLEQGEAIGRRFVDLLVEEDRERVAAIFREVRQGVIPALRLEARLRARDGGFRVVDTVVLSAAAATTGLLVAVRDVTEQRLALEAQRRSEQQMRALLDQVPGVLYRSAIGKPEELAFVSSVIEPMLGYSLQEWRANRDLWRRLLHPDEEETVLAELHAAAATGGPFRAEYRLRARSGEYRWIRDDARFVRDDADRPSMRQGVWLDVSARRETEAVIQRQESILLAVRAAAGIFLGAKDWPSAFAEALEVLSREVGADRGYFFRNELRRDGQPGQRLAATWPADAAAAEGEEGPGQGLSAQGLGRIEERLRKGQPYWGIVDAMPEPERSSLGRRGVTSLVAMPVLLRGFVCGHLRFEQLKQARVWTAAELAALRVAAEQFGAALQRSQTESALRLSERRLELSMWAADLGMWDWDVHSSKVFLNAKASSLLGLSEESRELPLADVEKMVHPDDLPAIWQGVHEHIAGARPHVEKEIRVGCNGGTWRWVMSRAKVAERGADGKPLRVCGVWVDRTAARKEAEERRKFEEQMQQTQKLESLGLLAGGIAHDFNNLLTVIHGFADLVLYQLPERSPLREPMEKIEQTVTRMSELTNQMLAYSGRGKFVVRKIDLNQFVRESTDFLKISVTKRATLVFGLAENPPFIEADQTQTRQVLLNLITNASEALPAAGGTIWVSTGQSEVHPPDLADVPWANDLQPGRFSWFEVRDNGCGMAPETVKRIFEPFFTTKFTGRGLGLAAVQGIVRSHKGFIRLRSVLGSGTSFRVYFPACEPERASTEPVLARPSPVAGAKGTILVVDDEEPIQQLVATYLGALGYRILRCMDGATAIETFRRETSRIDAVLLDLTMPKLSGEEVFLELRQINPAVKVILMSGYHELEATRHFAGKGLAGFISKPFKMSVLAEKLRQILIPEPAPA